MKTAAQDRFTELLWIETINFPHIQPKPNETRRFARAASALQVAEQALAEHRAGARHNIGEIAKLQAIADELVRRNRAGRPRTDRPSDDRT